MDTCSGSCIQSGAMDFICLSYDYFALLDLISCPELFSDSCSQYYVQFALLDVLDLGFQKGKVMYSAGRIGAFGYCLWYSGRITGFW